MNARRATATAAFGAAALASAGFGWAYLSGGPQLQGLTLGLAMVAFAVGFAAWAADMPAGPYAEHRPPTGSPEPERSALAADLRVQDEAIRAAGPTRRMLTAALGTLVVVVLLPLRSLLWRDVQPEEALRSTPWAPGVPVVDANGAPVRPEQLVVGTVVTAHPQGHPDAADAAVMLLRVDPARLQLPPERRAWVVGGIIAYSKICTHAGCPVGLYAEGAAELLCPCHQSVFKVTEGARPLFGPATRALPQLPLGLAPDGTLVALGDFPEPVGPGWWGQP